MKALAWFLAAIVHVQAAYGHGDHKPKHGGIMGRGDDEIAVELLAEKAGVVLYLEREDKPVATERIKGVISLVSPGHPGREAKLAPAGHNRLAASGLKPVAGDRLTARIVLPNGDELSWIFSYY
jgi:hypothetical protein